MFHLVVDSLLSVALATAGATHQARWLSLPLDTTVVVASTSTLWLDLRTGGSVRIVDGANGVVRIRATANVGLGGDCTTLLTRSDTVIRFMTERPAAGAAAT